MNAPLDYQRLAAAPLAASPKPSALEAARAAANRIAPLWPLEDFVAVNPFLGLAGQTPVEAAATLGRVAGARLTLPRGFYLERLADGRIGRGDLAAALAESGAAGLPATPQALLDLARRSPEARPSILPTIADRAAKETGRDWAGFAAERVSLFAAGWFDAGQSLWPAGTEGRTLYAAWREEALIDRTPDVAGLRGFRRAVAALPDTAEALIAEAEARLGLEGAALELFFHRLLATTGGWAGLARQKLWQAELDGGADETLLELLAVRLAWDVGLLRLFSERPGFLAGWREAWDEAAAPGPADRALAIDAVLHLAFEKAGQRELLAGLVAQSRPMPASSRKSVQAAFCIDVRSEVFRRALESVAPEAETIGFAGFFGFAFEYVPLGETHGHAQCPVLLKPSFIVCEGVEGADAEAEAQLGRSLRLRRRAASAWNLFKGAAVSSFAFVEAAGLAFAAKLVRDGFVRPDRRRATAARSGLPFDGQPAPRLEPRPLGERLAGLAPEARIDMAEAVLSAMSLKSGFARLVLLAGHGSTSLNNPHANGLDCGACGGHGGEPNAQVAAAILNDPSVRRGLADRGIVIPADTHFLAARHDTTTDEVAILSEDLVPASHAADLSALKARLAAAAKLARAERAAALHLDAGRSTDAQIFARAADWAQTRPEWGLAGCRAFIAAPRARTAGLDLGGRAFLHSYDWKEDKDFKVLELIMTAPVVVASWINLQYFGSAVDNDAFGGGNKVLHNVVGRIGVLEGQSGSLRAGLPWQSVHDGERLVHEPVRLSVLIEAPEEAMNAVIARHEGFRQLVDNGWIHLFSLDREGRVAGRYAGGLRWEAVAPRLAEAA